MLILATITFIFINCSCLRCCKITQPASNALFPLVCYTTLLGCYSKLFYRVLATGKLQYIEIEVFGHLQFTVLLYLNCYTTQFTVLLYLNCYTTQFTVLLYLNCYTTQLTVLLYLNCYTTQFTILLYLNCYTIQFTVLLYLNCYTIQFI